MIKKWVLPKEKPALPAGFIVFYAQKEYNAFMKINIKWLKENCKMIHYFGLGFIQVKIGQLHRMHFYTKLLPPIVPEEDVHNHRYDFESKILLGSFTQEIFNVIPGDTHLLEDESCQEGVETKTEAKPCSIITSSQHTYGVGCKYYISHEVFHRVQYEGDCITQLLRSPYRKDFAQVIRPKEQGKICPFSQKVEEKDLWKIIEEIVEKANNCV